MPTFVPNPQAEANLAFDVVAPADYTLRIVEITEFTAKSGNSCWKVRAEYTDPTACVKLDGTPAKNPGTILDSSIVVSDPEKQGRLRSLVEACGKTWGAVTSSDQLVGCEIQAKVGTEEYNGELTNKIKRYLPAVV